MMPSTASAQTDALADTPSPMYRHDQQHTGRSPYSGPEIPELKWSYTTGGYVHSSPAIGSDSTIYVGSGDNKLYAFNHDGTLKWSYATGGNIRSSPAIGVDGTIYVGSEDNLLYAINPNGTLKWSYATANGIESSPAIGSDGVIYIGSKDDKLYAINPDGTIKWSYTTGSSVESSPAIGSDGTIYIGSNNLYAINPDGTLKWNYASGGSSSPAVGTDGTIYKGANKNLHAINSDGTLKWSYTTGGSLYSSPAIGLDGTIYIGSTDKKVYAINSDGTLKWSYTTGGEIHGASPTIGANGTVYICSYDNYLHALDLDGTLKWKYDLGAFIHSSPTIGADGIIYIGSGDNKLYAIGENQPTNTSPSGGATKVSLEPTLQSSTFSGPDISYIHTASQWQITTTSGNYTSTVYDSGTDTTNKTSITVPSSTLSYSTTYYWHVRHKDNNGNWSDWSTSTIFTTIAEDDEEVWAVIIGVADYENFGPQPSNYTPSPFVTYDLEYADDDARELYEKLCPIWGEDHIKLLIDEDASKAGIRDAITEWMASQEDSEDTVLVYFSGHGNKSYIYPYDTLKTSYDNDISKSLMNSWLGNLDSERIVVMLDSCESGGFASALEQDGRVILSSSTADENSWAYWVLKHGLFTDYLLDSFDYRKLASVDTNGNLKISAEEIFQYVEPLVVSYEEEEEDKQHPELHDGYSGELDLFSIAGIALDVNPAGASMTIDGTYYPTRMFPLSLTWVANVQHTISVKETVSGGIGIRYLLSSWSDGDTSASRVLMGDEISALTANYKTQYYLDVDSYLGAPTGQGWYDEGTEVTVFITNNEASTLFTGWTGDVSSTNTSVSVIMDSPKTVTANWEFESSEDNSDKGDNGGLFTCSCNSAQASTSVNELLIGWGMIGICWGGGYYFVKRVSKHRKG